MFTGARLALRQSRGGGGASGLPFAPRRRACRRESLLRFGAEAVAVTLDRDGIAWAASGGAGRVFPVRARQVYDITGAGDAVLAALGFAVALGADWPTAIHLANLAGGVEVERLGVAPISRRDLLAELGGSGLFDQSKILAIEPLIGELEGRRRLGQQIVMTNGCFDLLHPGHVASLQYARRLGDCLVVGLNSDESVARLKGEGRPIIGEGGRARMLAALACVDTSCCFRSRASRAGRGIRPTSRQGGAIRARGVGGGDTSRAMAGQVVLAPLVEGFSTSEILQKARR